MGKDFFVAFDFGAESGRAVLGALNGGRLELEEAHRFANPTGRMNGALQWNLLAQWEEIKKGLRKCGTEPGGTKRAIESIGIDTWGVDFGLVSANGEILGNPVHYRDRRTSGVMEKVFQRISKQRIFETTGVQFMPINTLYQLTALAEANSDLLKAAETLLFMPDLFNFLLTGKRQSEFSIATTSQMYNPRKRLWADELLSELGIPTKILPSVSPSGTMVGAIKKEVAAECRVGAIPVIAPGSHDTASAVLAVPADTNDWCYISSGTWSLMGVELAAPLITELARKYDYTNEGGVGGRIRFLKNIAGLWLVQEVRRHFANEGREYSYTDLTQQAAKAEPFRTVIDPDHKPFLEPGDIPRKIERFADATQQRPPSSPGEYVRTCLEGLAMKYRLTLAGLEEVLGKRLKVIHIVGGGSQNELLNQMTADACGRPVIAGPSEATAIGNILSQAIALGKIRSIEQARAIVKASFNVKRYEPRDTKAWETAFERYGGVKQRH